MFVIFFLVGIIVSGSLAYAGLVRGELAISSTKKATGKNAKIIGTCCLIFALVLLVGAIVSVVLMLRG